MQGKTYAAIDIGTNAVRLLIKREDPLTDRPDLMLKKLLLVRVPLRLGFDVFADGIVSDIKAQNLIRLMNAYKELLRIYNVDRFRACATSAVRDASNGEELLEKVLSETDIAIDVLQGEEEARIIYNNHLEHSALDAGPYLFVDVGGGSTELNFIINGRLRASRSFNIGTVRILTDRVRPYEWEAMIEFLSALGNNYPNTTIIGSGGNINKLYKLAEVKNKDNHSLPVAELSKLYDMLKPLSIEQRMDRYDMREDRADVIVPAAEIFLKIASAIGSETIIVPRMGVADGIIDGLFLADKKKTVNIE